MTTAHGIYEYDGTELGAPGPDYMSLLTDTIESALVDVDDAIADLDLQTDSGWVPITTIGTGWASVVGDVPRLRRVGSRVDLAGSLTYSTGSYSDLLTVPLGFRLVGTYNDVNVGTAMADNGVSLGLRLNKATFKLRAGVAYPGTNPTVVRLSGSWYVD